MKGWFLEEERGEELLWDEGAGKGGEDIASSKENEVRLEANLKKSDGLDSEIQ